MKSGGQRAAITHKEYAQIPDSAMRTKIIVAKHAAAIYNIGNNSYKSCFFLHKMHAVKHKRQCASLLRGTTAAKQDGKESVRMKRITASALCGAIVLLLCACSPVQTGAPAAPPVSVSPTAETASATAPAVTHETTAGPDAGSSLKSCEAFESVSTDLDADGITERIEFVKKAEGVTVRVSRGENAWEHSLPAGSENAVSQYVLKNGKRSCVLFCYDLASDDYQTAAISLGSKLEVNILDGSVAGFENGVLTLNLTVDVAGTWLGSADYTVDEDMHLSRKGELYELSGVDETRRLTAKQALSAFTASGEKFTLEAGTVLRPVSSDLESVLYFRIDNRDGLFSFKIAHQKDNYWEFLIDGVPEREAFDGLEYYD